MQNVDKDLELRQCSRNLARKGKIAAKKIEKYTNDQIDMILLNIVKAIKKNEDWLGAIEIEAIGKGNADDKKYLNNIASSILYEEIKLIKTIGILETNVKEKKLVIGKPLGLILGLLPVINVTSILIFRVINAIKSKNAIMFLPYSKVEKSVAMVVKMLNEAAIEAGAPNNIISSIETYSEVGALELVKQKEIALVIGTDISKKIKNLQDSNVLLLSLVNKSNLVYIEKTGVIEKAIKNFIGNKRFNNGMIPVSENFIICEAFNEKEIIGELENQGAYFMNEEENEQLYKTLYQENKIKLEYVGESVEFISEKAKIKIPFDTKVLVRKQNSIKKERPLTFENGVVIDFYIVKDLKEGCDICRELANEEKIQGINVYTEDLQVIEKISEELEINIFLNIERVEIGRKNDTKNEEFYNHMYKKARKKILLEDVEPFKFSKRVEIRCGISDCGLIESNDDKIKIPEVLEGKKYNCYQAKEIETLKQEKQFNDSKIEEVKLLKFIDEIVETLKKNN